MAAPEVKAVEHDGVMIVTQVNADDTPAAFEDNGVMVMKHYQEAEAAEETDTTNVIWFGANF